jgi:hypothetical protein
MGSEEAWGVSGRLEPRHPSLVLTCGVVGAFGAIVEIAELPMLHARQELPLGGSIAGQFGGNNHPRHILVISPSTSR